MNKKGFTLIELMGVIVILSVIALITTPILFNLVSKTNIELSIEQEKIILDAARMWGAKNLYAENGTPSQDFVSFQTLREDGFLESKDLKNISEEDLKTKVVCISYVSNKFEYDIDNQDDCINYNSEGEDNPEEYENEDGE